MDTIRRNWIYFVIGGFGLGVLVRSFFDFGFSFSLFFALLSLVIGALFIFSKRKAYFLVALLLLSFTLGVIRFDIAALDTGSGYLDAKVGSEVEAKGIIIDEPDNRETNTKLTVRLYEVDGVAVEEKALITVDRYPQYNYGDRVSLRGELQKPEAFIGDDDKLFDYEAYLGKDGIYYLFYYPDAAFIEGRQGNALKQTLFDIKGAFLERIGRVIPEPESALLGGLVVGAKQSLGEDLLDDFRRTGIIHIVVLSGYNVTIVAEFIMRVLSFLPLVATWSLGIFSIALFAVMTGAGATIVRASIMAILVIIARATGRTYQITRALFLAAFFMVLHNPKILVFDSSFQLSFMATIGLIHLAPQLERYFGWVPSKWQLREFATATIATQLFVLPILLYKMGEVSIAAFPVNLLVLPFVPITMLLGFFTGMVGFISPLLSLPFAYMSDVLLFYQLFVVDLFARIPFASIHVEHFPLWAAVGMYAIYGLILIHFDRKERRGIDK